VPGRWALRKGHRFIMVKQWKQGNIIVENGFLHYYRIGREGTCPIILLHGFSDNGLCWSEVATALKENYDVIIPDMKSHGLSSRIQKHEIVDMASDVKTLITSLKISSPIIVGHSMGAMITYQLGARYPDLVKAVILEDPPWWLPKQEENETASRSMLAWAKDLEFQPIEEIEAINKKEHPNWSHEMIHIMSESKKQFESSSADTFIDIFKNNRQEWLSTISNLRKPTFLITGDPDMGGIVSNEVISAVRELNPKILIRTIPGVGHLIHFDKQKDFIDKLQEFLKLVVIDSTTAPNPRLEPT
jgi:N-formylmaleamate deformylase